MKIIMSLRWVGLILLMFHFFGLGSSVNDEGLALLFFKQNINNSAAVPSLDNWNKSDANPCLWNGIKCNREDKVVSISIRKKRLAGILRLDSGKLPALRRVNLRVNFFSGCLPVELFNATELRALILSENSFSGPVPDEIGNLRNLERLDLSANHFNGSIPSALLHCGRLRYLTLRQNNFGGCLPDGFGTSLKMLHQLILGDNNFSGSIGTDMGNLTSLQMTLDLSHNRFSGPIPNSLGRLPKSVYIYLAYNNLSGLIPRVGALLDAGQSSFVGNPFLCGPPLETPCPNAPMPLPDDTGSHGRRSCMIITVIVSAVVLVTCLLVFSFIYWYKKVNRQKRVEHSEHGSSENDTVNGKEICCFRTDELESLSGNLEQYNFVMLDSNTRFDLEQLLKAPAFILGKRRNGMLYKVVLDDGPTVVVRRLEDRPQRFREFQAEVEAISKIRHPNIVGLLAYCRCANEKLLIYPYVSGRDLATIIHGMKGTTYLKSLPWSIRLKIMKGIAEGLAFLHEFSPKRHVHGNLKPSNVLLDKNMMPQISDVGLSRLSYSETEESLLVQSLNPMTRGTSRQDYPITLTPANSSSLSSYYIAPEAAKSAKPSQKWDVYSFGVILLELISGKPSTMRLGSAEMDIVRWIQLSIEVKPLSYIIDPFLAHEFDKEEQIVAVIKTALACVHGNPDRRPSMRNVSNNLGKLS